MPLGEQIRPQTLEDIVGQQHILGEGKPLRRILESGKIPNMIFYGPPGIGKTTVCRIIAERASMQLHMLNGTIASTSDIKEVIADIGTIGAMGGILLYLDEIQYLNKKQQQILLSYIETGEITLIASTTENPYFSIYSAVLSRCTIFEFKSVPVTEMERAVARAFRLLFDGGEDYVLDEGVIEQIAMGSGGDVRKAMNAVELSALSAQIGEDGKFHISKEITEGLTQRSNMRYDKDGEQHYDLLSALQKSIRGSDENAALYYMARLLCANDLLSVCRRLLVIASEDIGLAYPNAAVITKACVDNALQLGMPEARIPLAQAVVMLATSPKSNSSYLACAKAFEDVEVYGALDYTRQLQNKH